MRQRTMMAWGGVMAAIVLATISGLILGDETWAVRITMMLGVAAALLSLLAVLFFLVGLKNFKIELRQTYTILCVGIGVFGLAQVQLPLVSVYSLGFLIDSGAIAVAYLIGVTCIFWSMRSFSRLLGIKSLWRSGLLALATTGLVAFAVSFLPHVAVTIDELLYDISVALSIWSSVFITFAAVLAYKIRQKIGLMYDKSMTWLFSSFAILSFAGWHYAAVQLLLADGNWYYDYSVPILPFVVGAGALIVAGFTFGSITVRASAPSAEELIAKKLVTSLTPAQEVEIVLYVSNLVSNPAEIEDTLKELRVMVAKVQPGFSFSPEDQKALSAVYTTLEEYLLHRDPLRMFTHEELRERISKRFSLSSAVRTTLWS